MSVKIQYSVETAILFAFSLLLLVGLIYYFAVANNTNLQYETTPFVLSSLEFYNFQTIGSTCSFDFAFQTNSYLPYPKYELSFILNNGQKIVPDYNAYSESVTPVLSSGYQYTFTLIGVPNYNGSVCSVMGQQSVNHAYVKYVSYKNANGKTIVQPVSTNYVFKINSASTIPVQLYNNNTVFITGSVIPYSGYVYISYQNKTSVPGSPFTLGEYVYLPTGNYTLSYTNESNPVAFQYWSGNGGVIIKNMFNTTTNMTVINNGEIYLSLRNLLKPSATFIIYSNKTYSTPPGKFNITANFTKNGYYTYYVNNQPYNGCININKTSCVMSFSVAGDYIISATFKNSTVFAEATPIEVYVFNPLSATLSSNETLALNKTNVLLTISTSGGLQPFTYSFYANNAPIQNCTGISTPTCVYNIDNPPNDRTYNYTFIANVSDADGELVTTNNVIVEGIVAIPIILYNSQTLNTPAPFQQMIQINETQNPFNGAIIYNKSFANFEFIYRNGTVIPAWIESNQSGKLTIWVKLANGIPATTSITIYLESAGSKNLLNATGTTGIGEAPQLSCPNPANTIGCSTYAEYDNGASVFDFYANFAGTSSSWLECYGTCGTVTVNNGLTLSGGLWWWGVSTFHLLSPPAILEYYGKQTQSGGYGPMIGVFSSHGMLFAQMTADSTPQWGIASTYGNMPTAWTYGGSSAYNTWYLVSAVYNSGAESLITNYTTTQVTATYSISTNARQLVLASYTSSTNVFQWIRTRAYPPNGVMPTVTVIS